MRGDIPTDTGDVWVFDEHRRQHLRDIRSLEQFVAGEHLEQDRPEGPNVHPFINRKALRLLGSHVGRGPHRHAHLRRRRRQADGG